ncbi:MAG: lysophospholipase [Myxococcota bacterium]|nr:lysophospholipase [Myxococcota bacterium]
MVDASHSATGHIDAHDGKRLFYRWAPVETPRALLVVVHGFAEHSGRYQHVFDWMNARGYACLGFDYRGHGRADGKARYVDSFQEYVQDTLRAMELGRARVGDVPLYLLGHSQGGLISLSLALEYGDQISGLVVSSPSCGVAIEVPAWKEALGRIAAIVAPGLSIPSGLDANLLSHDPAVVQAYVDDPLIGTDARARWYVEFRRAQDRLLQEAHRVSVPALVMQAGSDTMASPSASKAVFQGLGSPEKRWIEYEGFYHELFNEPDKERVFGDVDDWLTSRLQ